MAGRRPGRQFGRGAGRGDVDDGAQWIADVARGEERVHLLAPVWRPAINSDRNLWPLQKLDMD